MQENSLRYNVQFIVFLFFSLLILSGCKKNTNITPSVSNNDTTQTVNSQLDEVEFPLDKGNKWKYLRVNTLTNQVDTIESIVVNEKNVAIDSVVYNINFYLNQNVIDSGLYLKSPNFIAYKGLTFDPQFFDFYLNFPCDSGDYWIGPEIADTLKVIDQVYNVPIYGHVYDTIYILKSVKYYSGGGFKKLDLFIAPNIGIVKYTYQFSLPPGFLGYSLSLLEFDIKEE